MSTFRYDSIPGTGLKAIKLLLLVAAADLTAGAVLLVDQASAPPAAAVSASAYELHASQHSTWHELGEIIATSFATRSRVYYIAHAEHHHKD